MAIQIATTRQSVSNAYCAGATFIGTTTGNPGVGTTPANESTGGGYVRKATVWTPSSGGTNTGSAVTLDVPASTISHVILCSGVSGANLYDHSDVADIVYSAAGQAVVTPTYVQT